MIIYITYHLWREPETTIDLHFQGLFVWWVPQAKEDILVNVDGDNLIGAGRIFFCNKKTPPPWRDSDAMMKCFFSFLDVMRVLFVSFSPATWLKSSKKNTIVVYSHIVDIYMEEICVYAGFPNQKVRAWHFFFLRANGASSGFLKDVCQQFQDGAFGEFMDGWGCWGVRVFFGYAGTTTTTTTTADIWFQFQCFFPQFSQSLIMSNMYIIYVSPTYNVSIPLDPKTHEWKMKVLRPPKYGWNIQPPKNEGYGFPWYIIRLMAEILHHLGCIKPVNHGAKLPINGAGFLNHQQYVSSHLLFAWCPSFSFRGCEVAQYELGGGTCGRIALRREVLVKRRGDVGGGWWGWLLGGSSKLVSGW